MCREARFNWTRAILIPETLHIGPLVPKHGCAMMNGVFCGGAFIERKSQNYMMS